MPKDTTSAHDRPSQPLDAGGEDDVQGHSLAAALGLDAMHRGGSRAPREQPDAELPPLTRRFPDLRRDRTEPPRKP